MFNLLVPRLRAIGHKSSALDYFLPRFSALFPGEFYCFADCGAAVGFTAVKYAQIQSQFLTEDAAKKAQIYCYEPLPENLRELKSRVQSYSQIRVRPYAVSDFCGKASFAIPRRTLDEASHWGKGTSAVGFLGNVNNLESIEVDVTRLDNECEEGFDFIKLDLQGGERKALQGLGDKLTRAKLIYAEHQLLGDPQDGALNWLLECGFTCFFDRLQIGVRTNVGEIPISLLIELGIVVDRLLLPDIRGVGKDYMLFGYFDSSSSSLGLSGLLSPAIINDLMSAGVYYLQTDVIAFRPSYLNRLLRTL